jgi:hypothetical protein
MKLYEKFGKLQIAILVLTVITAVIHLALPGTLFILNGLGYLGLLVLYFVKFNFLPIPRRWIRWGLVGYAALTVILYVVMQVQSGGAFVSALGIFDKVIELVLIGLLVRTSSST